MGPCSTGHAHTCTHANAHTCTHANAHAHTHTHIDWKRSANYTGKMFSHSHGCATSLSNFPPPSPPTMQESTTVAAAVYASDTGLSKRVSEWEKKIKPILEKEVCI